MKQLDCGALRRHHGECEGAHGRQLALVTHRHESTANEWLVAACVHIKLACPSTVSCGGVIYNEHKQGEVLVDTWKTEASRCCCQGRSAAL